MLSFLQMVHKLKRILLNEKSGYDKIFMVNNYYFIPIFTKKKIIFCFDKMKKIRYYLLLKKATISRKVITKCFMIMKESCI